MPSERLNRLTARTIPVARQHRERSPHQKLRSLQHTVEKETLHPRHRLWPLMSPPYEALRGGDGPVPRANARSPATACNFPHRADGFRWKAPAARRVPLPAPSTTTGTGRQPHPEARCSFDCSRIAPRPNSSQPGDTSKTVHTLMINSKSGILAPRSYLPSVVSGVRRRVANSLGADRRTRTALSRSCNDSIGSVHPKPAAPLLFSGRAHHRIVVAESGREIPFLIDNNPKMVNKGRGRLRNDVTTELYRTPTKWINVPTRSVAELDPLFSRLKQSPPTASVPLPGRGRAACCASRCVGSR